MRSFSADVNLVLIRNGFGALLWLPRACPTRMRIPQLTFAEVNIAGGKTFPRSNFILDTVASAAFGEMNNSDAALALIALSGFFSRKKNGTTHDILPAHSFQGDLPHPGKIAKVSLKVIMIITIDAKFFSGSVRRIDVGKGSPRSVAAGT
jgi:hypothetical protein